MTLKNMDYSRTTIYKIVSCDLNIKDCYVGHTTNLISRRCEHKSRCNNEKDKAYNKYLYQFIRANGGWENWSVIEVENAPV